MVCTYDLSRFRPGDRHATGRRQVKPMARPMDFGRIIEAERLISTWRRLAQRDSAPGPDGVRFQDVSPIDMCELLRQTAAEIRRHGYLPWERRIVPIPKANGKVREISIRSVLNRVVSARVKDGLEPYFESVFLPWSCGFRPRLSTWHAIAAIRRGVQLGNYVFSQADIVTAFPSLPLDRLIQTFAGYLPCRRTREIVEAILRGAEDRNRERGIDMGDPFSPLALNVYCHVQFDLPFREIDIPVRARYADNLGLLTRTVLEGASGLSNAANLFQEVSLELKCDEPRDLRDPATPVSFLGFDLAAQECQLRPRIPERAWESLGGLLAEARLAIDPAYTVHAAVKGWVEAYGPALEEAGRSHACRRLRRMACKAELRELSAGSVERWTRASHQRWQRLLSNGVPANNRQYSTIPTPPAVETGYGG